jgi:hypothetical protein
MLEEMEDVQWKVVEQVEGIWRIWEDSRRYGRIYTDIGGMR